MRHGHHTGDETDADLVRLFRVLGREDRLSVLRLLLRHPGGLTRREIVARLPLDAATVCVCVIALRKAGLVVCRPTRRLRPGLVIARPEALAALRRLVAAVPDAPVPAFAPPAAA